VVARLCVRRDELINAIFSRVSGAMFDRSEDEDAEYVAGLRAAVAAAVDYGLEGIEHGEQWAGPVPDVVVEQARRAARVGVSLETVLRRYVAGHTLLGEFVMEEVEREPLPVQQSVLREVMRAQAAALDRLMTAITREYRDEIERVGRSPEARRLERVRRLLAGGGDGGVGGGAGGAGGGGVGGAGGGGGGAGGGVGGGGAVEGVGLTELDYDLDGWHLGAIAVGAGAERTVRELAAGANRRLLSVPSGERSVWVWLGGQGKLTPGDLGRALASGGVPEGVVLAVGEPGEGIEGWRVTHRQAQAALVVALRRTGIPPTREGIRGAVTRYADVALLASALRDEMLGRALVEIYLAPLNDARSGSGSGAVLCETLRAYLAAEGSVSSTAAALGVVRKTVENRLQTIEERLGRTLHPCPAELEVALALEELGPGAVLSPSESSIADQLAPARQAPRDFN
jgi:PucR C-terminal helix-turn-helix domain/GGDEF-like domain